MSEEEQSERGRTWFRNFFLWVAVFLLAALSFSLLAGMMSGGTASPSRSYGGRNSR